MLNLLIQSWTQIWVPGFSLDKGVIENPLSSYLASSLSTSLDLAVPNTSYSQLGMSHFQTTNANTPA